jgi:hypothetical protein
VSDRAITIPTTASRWIGVAVVDWESAGLDSFYPADVPDDWHLTYYANMAMAVVLPPSRWLTADTSLLAQWSEQTHKNFWFYLLCESRKQVLQAIQLIGAFNDKCAGLIVAADVHVEEVDSVAVLVLGQSALRCDTGNLRALGAQISAWLTGFSGEHGLVVLDGQLAGKVKEVQTLLELMGVLS